MYRPNWKDTLLKEYGSVNQSVVCVLRSFYVTESSNEINWKNPEIGK